MVGSRRNSDFPFRPEPPVPPWSFSYAFVGADGDLSGTGGWDNVGYTRSSVILTNQLRRAVAGNSGNRNLQDGPPTTAGIFLDGIFQSGASGFPILRIGLGTAGDPLNAAFIFDSSAGLISVNYLGNTSSIGNSGYDDGVPHTFSMQIDALGHVTLSIDAIEVITQDPVVNVPAAIEQIVVEIEGGSQTNSPHLFSMDAGTI